MGHGLDAEWRTSSSRNECIAMKTQTLADLYGALTCLLLLILTAWGNAVAMFVVAALGLGVGVLIFRRSFWRGALAALLGLVVATALAAMVHSA